LKETIVALLVAVGAVSLADEALAQAGNAGSGYDPMQRMRTDQQSRKATPEGDPELGGLPAAPGAEDTYYLCSACHSVALIKQQSLSDERWDYLWNWMIKEQGMPEQDAETKDAILGYLKTRFSSER
jgi:hypothetical protein